MSGGPGDYGVFYDRHLGVVRSYVASRVEQPEVMFDLVAETFARALDKRALFDPARGPAVGWLLGIARNLIVDSARRGQVEAISRVRLGMAPVELDDEQLARLMEQGRDDLRAALGSIPADQRDAVLRRVVLDESYPTIARQLSCSEQVVRKRVSRGLASLRANSLIAGRPQEDFGRALVEQAVATRIRNQLRACGEADLLVDVRSV